MGFALFYREKRLTLLLVLLISVAGLAAFQALPRQEDPELGERYAAITTRLPGASAEMIEALVTRHMEAELEEVAEINRISSRSQAGVSLVTMQLDDRVNNTEDAWGKVRSRMRDAERLMPSGTQPPEFKINTTAAETMLVALVWRGDGPAQIDILARLARILETSAVALAETRETDLYGEPREEILVTIDPPALAALGLDVSQVSTLIQNADSKGAAGRIHGAGSVIGVQVAGALDSVERIKGIPLRRTADGQTSRLGDVATVERVTQDPPDATAMVDGLPGVVLAIKIESGARVDLWAERMRARIAEFDATLPAGIESRIIFDQSAHTVERIDALTVNLLMGALLVLAVLFVMMGWRSAVVVGLALPLTLLAVLPLFKILGVPLHQVSITGLIIALGILIDNAIIAVDEYSHRRKAGMAAGDAVAAAGRYLAVPLAASTITTVLTFLPLVVMPGNAGEFVRSLGIGVILSLVCSLGIALTVVLAVAGWLDDRWPTGATATGFRHHGIIMPARVSAWYRKLLVSACLNPRRSVMIACALPLAGFVLAGQLVEQFFPPTDRAQFQVQIKTPPQTPLAATQATVERVRAIIHAHPEVLNSHWFVGERPPRVYYNTAISEDATTRLAGGFVDTRSAEDTAALLPVLQRELLESVPGALVLALPYEQGPPVVAPIEIRLTGPDLNTLRELGEQVRLILSQSKAVTFTEATIIGGQPRLNVDVDEDVARLLGLGLSEIAAQISARLDGAVGGTLLEGTEELAVRVRLGGAARAEEGHLGAALMWSPALGGGEAWLPLDAVARLSLVPELSTITRRNGERINTVIAYLDPFAKPSETLRDVKRRLADAGFGLPPGYRLSYGGESEGSDEARGNLMGVFAPLGVLMVATVVLAFNSYRMGAIIVTVGILSIGCAMATLWGLGYPLGFMAIIGTMGLIGLVINDSIVVLAALKGDPDAAKGDTDAVVRVVGTCTRHVISTTLTTVGGFLPLVLWGGNFWPPLAVAVSGGMLGGSVLALFFVPQVFLFVVRVDRRLFGAGVLAVVATRAAGLIAKIQRMKTS